MGSPFDYGNPVLTQIHKPRRLWTPGGNLIPTYDREYELVLEFLSENLRTNAGREWQKEQMSGTVAAVANFIGVTDEVGYTPAATDTTLTSEETTNGLARAAGTFALNSGSAFYTLSKQMTYSGGSPITLTGAAMFNASSGGTMPFAAAYASTATLVNGDQITTTWTINI